MDQIDMPYNCDGIVPDILFDLSFAKECKGEPPIVMAFHTRPFFQTESCSWPQVE